MMSLNNNLSKIILHSKCKRIKTSTSILLLLEYLIWTGLHRATVIQRLNITKREEKNIIISLAYA